MPPQLVALGDGPDILLDKPILLIGRHQECDIQIPSRKISRRHCCIAQVNDHLVVRDLGSTNGIRVNGARVNEGKLESGDELIIGNFKYQVRLNAVAAPAPAPIPKQAAKPSPKPAPAPAPKSLPSPFDSGEDPIPLSEGPLGPILPTNKSQPPASKNLKDIPLAILPESMSLEPMSEDGPGPGSAPK